MPQAAFAIGAPGDDALGAKNGPSYPPTGNFAADSTGTTVEASKSFEGGGVGHRYRNAFLRFDTSSLPDDAAVTGASLRVRPTARDADDGRSLSLDWFDWGTAVESADVTAAAGTNAHAGTPLASIAVGSTLALELEDPATFVNKDGHTYLRTHVSGGAPGGFNYLAFAAHGHPTLGPPELVVDYAVPRVHGRKDATLLNPFGYQRAFYWVPPLSPPPTPAHPFVGASTAAGAALPSITAARPGAAQPGDAMLLLVSTSPSAEAGGPGEGWEQVPTTDSDGANVRLLAWLKFFDSNGVEPSSYAVAWTGGAFHSVAACLAYRGVNRTNNALIFALPTPGGPEGAVSLPARSRSEEGGYRRDLLVVAYGTRTEGAGQTSALTPPAGMAERLDASSNTTGQNRGLMVADAPAARRGGPPTRAATAASPVYWSGLVLALRTEWP